jgi:hypothetical protein
VHFRRFLYSVCFSAAILGSVAGAAAGQAPRPAPSPVPSPVASPSPPVAVNSKDAAKDPSAEQVAETAIFIYGFGGGRNILNQIRKSAIERGKTSVMNADGQMQQAVYQKYTARGDTLSKEKIRLDQEFPGARYSLVYSGEKTFGIFNDEVFTPRDDAAQTFENQIFYSIESLLRYKENESKLTTVGKQKRSGVDYHVLDLTDLRGRKIRYYVSAKTFRVMILEYEIAGVKYVRRYYDYNSAQGTLVPFRSVLYADGKKVEETEIGTVTFGQKVDDGLFAVG